MFEIVCERQIVGDAGARHLQVVDALFSKVLLGAFVTVV